MQKDGNRLEGKSLVLGGDIGGATDLPDIEILIAQETPMTRSGIHIREHIELYAVRLDRTLLQRSNDLIVATCKG